MKGPLPPLLTHITLHGLETALTQAFPHRGRQHGPPPKVVIYADDLGMLHQDRSGIEHGQQLVSEWLRPLGLTLKPSKTRITPTRETNDGQPGFDCLGFPLRQYPVGRATSGKDSHGRLLGCKTLITPSRAAITRQRTKLPQSIARAKQTTQDTFIGTRAPHMRGWSHDYSRVVSAQVFRTLELYALCAAAQLGHRPPSKAVQALDHGQIRACRRGQRLALPTTPGRARADVALSPIHSPPCESPSHPESV